eukprot:5349382-Amphidinium_carterae.1
MLEASGSNSAANVGTDCYSSATCKQARGCQQSCSNLCNKAGLHKLAPLSLDGNQPSGNSMRAMHAFMSGLASPTTL